MAGAGRTACGRIDPTNSDIDCVELRFANGLILQDDASEGVALFITDEPVRLPATVVMIDAAGTDTGSDPAFPGP